MRTLTVTACLMIALCHAVLAAGLPEARPETAGMDPRALNRLDSLIRQSIHDGQTAGAVCIVGHNGRIVYRKAFGYAALHPQKRLMTVDTVFDLASLTKVTATAPSILRLVEQGRINLNSTVASVWPEYAANGKGRVTIRQLLVHTGGLSAGHGFFRMYGEENKGRTPGGAGWIDRYPDAMATLAAASLRYTPDSRFTYSDDGFMTLGEVVRRVSGKPLDVFAHEEVFAPLKMNDTTYRPGAALSARAALTEKRWDDWLQGQVHDPSAWAIGGVAGHAGLFSTADDLARYCQMYLNGGELDGARVLGAATVRAMTSPASPEGLPVRGLGWDIGSGYTRRGDLFSPASFGHTGWTGTSLWIDPPSNTFVVLLANRVHVPNGGVNTLQWRVSNVVASGVTDLPPESRAAAHAPPRPAAVEPPREAEPARAPSFLQTRTGIDVLAGEGFARLKGRKIGLITNPTGIDRRRRATADLFFEQHEAGALEIITFFGPEHGIRADQDDIIADEKDPKTGLPVYSLYNYRDRIFKPTPEMLKGVDTLVFDVQDIGVRYYTYITTMAYAMEAAKENGLKMVVLDRPNPINGVTVDGPALDMSLRSFAGHYPIPVRHGMTVGELARFFNEEYEIGCDLEVVRMENWRRGLWFDQTGLPWVNPSPNIRNLNQAMLYAAIGMLEASNVSVGRGTEQPFELFGAPWVDDVQLAAELNRLNLPGLSFTPIRFTPNASLYRTQECGGVNVQLLDRDAMEGTRSAVAILDVLQRLYGRVDKGPDVLGSKGMIGRLAVPESIVAGVPVSEIAATWEKDVAAFRQTRARYLIYP